MATEGDKENGQVGAGAGEPPAQPAWSEFIEAAVGRVRPAVIAQDYVEGLQSASKPQKFRCDDGELYAVKFQGNPDGNGRAIFIEQVVGLLGRLIGAPVAEVQLVSVTAELLAPLGIEFNGVKAAPGLHHGSRWAHDFSDRNDLVRYADRNRPALAALHLLYSWLYCSGDHQVIYGNMEPHDVLSVDHSRFLPGGTNWSSQTLLDHRDNFEMDQQFKSLDFTESEYDATLSRVKTVAPEQIAEIVGAPPDQWGVPQADRMTLAGYIAHRRTRLLANFGRTAG